MKTLFLQFADEGEATAMLAPFIDAGMVIDVIGVISVATGEVLNTPDGPTPEMSPLPGWFVNVLAAELPEDLALYEVFPATPARVFAIEPEPLRVPQEVSMAQCRLALHDLHGIDLDADEEFLALADLLSEDQRARARFELRTRTTVELGNLLVDAICAAKDWNAAELFVYAAAQ
jgi:hypothetical protein